LLDISKTPRETTKKEDRAVREMTMKEYFYHSVMQEVIKDAEKEGIKIVDVKARRTVRPQPRLATNRGEIVLPLVAATIERE
jgi:hypothetical protein